MKCSNFTFNASRWISSITISSFNFQRQKIGRLFSWSICFLAHVFRRWVDSILCKKMKRKEIQIIKICLKAVSQKQLLFCIAVSRICGIELAILFLKFKVSPSIYSLTRLNLLLRRSNKRKKTNFSMEFKISIFFLFKRSISPSCFSTKTENKLRNNAQRSSCEKGRFLSTCKFMIKFGR